MTQQTQNNPEPSVNGEERAQLVTEFASRVMEAALGSGLFDPLPDLIAAHLTDEWLHNGLICCGLNTPNEKQVEIFRRVFRNSVKEALRNAGYTLKAVL